MAKLPDVQAFGAPDTPSPQGGVPSIAPSPVAAAGAAGGRNLLALADKLREAGDRQMTYEEGADRLRAIRDFREKAANETIRLMAEDDIASPAVTKNYGAYMNQLEQETLKSHGGRQESRLKLSDMISSMKMGFVDKVSSKGAEALHQKAITELGEEANVMAQAVYEKPDALMDQYLTFSRFVDDQPISPEVGRAQKSAALGYMAETAALRLISQRRFDSAVDIIGDPDIQRAIPEARRKRIMSAIEQAQKPMDPVKLSENEILVEPGTGRTLARGLPKDNRTDIEKRAVLAGKVPGTPEFQQFIEDATLKPGVSINMKGEGRFVEKLGEITAEKLGKLNDNAQAATLTLTEIDRAKTALDSGKFTTGSFGEFRAEVARFAEFMGAPDEIKNAIGDAATADTFEAATKRLALNEIPKLERTLVAGLKIVQESLPALSRTPEGNRILLDVMERVANREIQLAELANDISLDPNVGDDPRKIGREMLKSMREMEKSDPIITEELRQRIKDGTKNAPKSIADVFNELKGASSPEGVAIPDGFEYVGKTPDGKVRVKNKATGRIGTLQ